MVRSGNAGIDGLLTNSNLISDVLARLISSKMPLGLLSTSNFLQKKYPSAEFITQSL